MKISLYFCGVKKSVRYEAAAKMQRFLYQLISNIKRIEWGNSNVPEGVALTALTARNSLILFNV